MDDVFFYVYMWSWSLAHAHTQRNLSVKFSNSYWENFDIFAKAQIAYTFKCFEMFKLWTLNKIAEIIAWLIFSNFIHQITLQSKVYFKSLDIIKKFFKTQLKISSKAHVSGAGKKKMFNFGAHLFSSKTCHSLDACMLTCSNLKVFSPKISNVIFVLFLDISIFWSRIFFIYLFRFARIVSSQAQNQFKDWIKKKMKYLL